MDNGNKDKIIKQMNDLLAGMQLYASMGIRHQEMGDIPLDYWIDLDEHLIRVTSFWPFWRKTAEEVGVDPAVLNLLQSSINRIALDVKNKKLGPGFSIFTANKKKNFS